MSFGVITGSLGIVTLLTQVNGLTALLGMLLCNVAKHYLQSQSTSLLLCVVKKLFTY